MNEYNKITALYSRLSVGDEDRDGGESNSIVNQKAFLERYAQQQRLTNIRHYIDDDESGRFFDRSAYSRMMEDVENGKIGVCTVTDVGHPKLPGLDRERLYYTLVPLYATETIFTPVDTTVYMRPAMTHDEALKLIEQIPIIENTMDIPLDANSKELPEYYRSLMRTHECKDLFRVIITIHCRSKKASESKKKLCQTDQNFMRDAEEILYGELSVALGIGKDEVPAFIERSLKAV